MLKIGEKIRILDGRGIDKAWVREMDNTIGKEGVVIDIDTTEEVARIDLGGGEDEGKWWYQFHSLERIPKITGEWIGDEFKPKPSETEDPHAGMIYYPMEEKWGWGLL